MRGQDAVAQAPAIQERIQCYVISALQILYAHAALAAQLHGANDNGAGAGAGPPPPPGIQVIVVTATVDQAAQAQRLFVGLGGTLGLRTALCVGASCGAEQMQSELQALQKQPPHVLVGTPHKLFDLFSLRGLATNSVRLLVVDECDQLIARNLADHVLNLARLLPPTVTVPVPGAGSGPPGGVSTSPLMVRSPLPGAFDSPFASSAPMSRFGSSTGAGGGAGPMSSQGVASAGPPPAMATIDRQMAILSCTVPQDVLAFAANLQLKEPVKVLVRRDNGGGGGGGGAADNGGGASSAGGLSRGGGGGGGGDGGSSGGGSMRGLKQFYLYLAVGGPGTPGFNGGPRRVGGATSSAGGGSGAAIAREWKLEALADLCEDHAFEHAVVFASSLDAIDAITYKLGSRALEAFALHPDMGPQARAATVHKFRSTQPNRPGLASKRVLVVLDALSRGLTDVGQVPLVINWDTPRAVEDYVHRCVDPPLSLGVSGVDLTLKILSLAASRARRATTRAASSSTSSHRPRSTCCAASRASSASRLSSCRTTLRPSRSDAPLSRRPLVLLLTSRNRRAAPHLGPFDQSIFRTLSCLRLLLSSLARLPLHRFTHTLSLVHLSRLRLCRTAPNSPAPAPRLPRCCSLPLSLSRSLSLYRSFLPSFRTASPSRTCSHFPLFLSPSCSRPASRLQATHSVPPPPPLLLRVAMRC